MPRVSDFIRQPNYSPRSPQNIEFNNFNLSGGLNTYDPPEVIDDKYSPYLLNARTNTGGQVETRNGVISYIEPQDQSIDVQQTSTAGAGDQDISQTIWVAQKFTAGVSEVVTRIDLNVKNPGGAKGPILVWVYSDDGGVPGDVIAQSSITASDVDSSYAYETARFTEPAPIVSGTSYWIVAYLSEGGEGAYDWSTTTNTTLGYTSSDYGSTWDALSASLNFKVYTSAGDPVLGLFRGYFSDGSKNTMWAVGTTLYAYDDSTVTTVNSGLSASATQYWFAQADDYVFYSNGYDAPRRWDGTTDSAIPGSPPIFKQIIVHKNRLWGVVADDPTRLFFSDEADYTTYTSTNFVYVPAPKTADAITGIDVIQDNLIVWTRNNKYVLYGSDLTNFVLRKASGFKGAVNDDVVQTYQNYAFFLSDDGVYMFNGNTDKIISAKIKSKIDAIPDKSLCRSVIHDNKYYLFYPAPAQAHATNCLVYDMVYESWWDDDGTHYNCAHKFNGSGDDGEVIFGGHDAGFLVYGDTGTSDMGKRINFEFHTKYSSYKHPSRYKRLRSFYPQFEPQEATYDILVQHDTDLRNSVITYDVPTGGTGYTWGGGGLWGSSTWGSDAIVQPSIAPTSLPRFKYIQHRFKKDGVNTPVTVFGYTAYYQVQRNQ